MVKLKSPDDNPGLTKTTTNLCYCILMIVNEMLGLVVPDPLFVTKAPVALPLVN